MASAGSTPAPARGGQPRPVPSATALYTGITHLATFSPELGDIKDAAIYVRGNMIEWVGPAAALPPELASADEVISCADRVIIPGLVNTHHHMYQTLTRCVAQVGWGPGLLGLLPVPRAPARLSFRPRSSTAGCAWDNRPASSRPALASPGGALAPPGTHKLATCRTPLLPSFRTGLAALQLALGALPRLERHVRGGRVHRHQAGLRRAAAQRVHLLLGWARACAEGAVRGV